MAVSKQFLTTQAATLLAFAKATSDPQLSAKLVAKAADLRMRAESLSDDGDLGPQPPDVIHLPHTKN